MGAELSEFIYFFKHCTRILRIVFACCSSLYEVVMSDPRNHKNVAEPLAMTLTFCLFQRPPWYE